MRRLIPLLTIMASVVAFGAVSLRAPRSFRPSPMSPQAKAYLDRAIALFREQHINSSKADWPKITQEAYAAASDARTTADTYPAIRLIIKELGEKHTILIEPDEAKADMTGKASGRAKPPPLVLPEAMRLKDGSARSGFMDLSVRRSVDSLMS